MGRRTERFRSHQAGAHASRTQQRAMERRQAAEDRRYFLEQGLGTAAQREGELGVDPNVSPFTQRFQLDRAAARSLAGHEKGYGIFESLAHNEKAANRLMEQAEEAARSGDLEKASALKSQAEEKLVDPRTRGSFGGPGMGWYPLTNPEQVRSVFSVEENAAARAAGQLGSPLAQSMGEMVHQGREFLDRDSETSREFRASLRDPALEAIEGERKLGERGLASERRGALRQQRDVGLSRGAGRRATAEVALGRRTAERFGTARADLNLKSGIAKAKVIADTNRFFEEYSREFASNSIAMADAWLDNRSGVREQFHNSMDRLAAASAEISQNNAQRHLQFMVESEENHNAEVNRNISLATTVVAAALAVTGVGFAALGAVGGGLGMSAATATSVGNAASTGALAAGGGGSAAGGSF